MESFEYTVGTVIVLVAIDQAANEVRTRREFATGLGLLSSMFALWLISVKVQALAGEVLKGFLVVACLVTGCVFVICGLPDAVKACRECFRGRCDKATSEEDAR